MDTMIAIRQFEDTSKVLDDGIVEQIFDNLESLEMEYERALIRWVRFLQAAVMEDFGGNVEKEFVCLRSELKKQLNDKEKVIEDKIAQVEHEKEIALEDAETRWQIELQNKKFRKSKNLLDAYGK